MQGPRFLSMLVACALVGAATTARAGEFKLGEDPVTAIMKWRPTTPDPEVKDYVRASRPADEDIKYKSLVAPKAERPALRSKKEVKAMTDGLDSKGAALRARGTSLSGSGNSTAQQLQAAAAESRRRAAEAFGTAK